MSMKGRKRVYSPEIRDNDSDTPQAIAALTTYRTAARNAAAEMRNAAHDYLNRGRQDLHDYLMLGIEIEHMPSHIVRALRDRIEIGSSFAASMAMTNALVRGARETDAKDFLRITSKEHGRALAESLGLRVARRHQSGVTLDEVTLRPRSVVKPTYSSGSRGVLICDDDGRLTLVRNAKKVKRFDDYLRTMREWISSGRIRQDSWIVEEYLTGSDGQPARDLKFYAFYGKVGLTLECKRHPEAKYCFYDDLEPVNTGKHMDKKFVGDGVDPSWITEMEALSRRIPLPFLRIDMYKTCDGLRFGEFTTVPGKYQEFNVEYDRRLGELWNRARAEILADFLSGRQFPEFAQFSLGSRQ
jgi:hypothetical protein